MVALEALAEARGLSEAEIASVLARMGDRSEPDDIVERVEFWADAEETIRNVRETTRSTRSPFI